MSKKIVFKKEEIEDIIRRHKNKETERDRKSYIFQILVFKALIILISNDLLTSLKTITVCLI